MSLDTPAGTKAPASLPLQFVSAEIMPLVGGKFSIALHATFLDETEMEFVGEDLAHAHVDTVEQALTVIRDHVAILQAA
jgi:hypothetical protein